MRKVAPFLVLTAGILWGLIGLFVRRLNSMGFHSMEIVNIRAITTSLLLFIFLFFYDKNMLKIKLRDLWCFIGTGILSIVFFNYCYFRAITMTSLSVAAVLLYTAPAIVMLLSALLFHEKITVIKLISITATFVGCCLVTGIVGTSGALSLGGVLVGLGAGLGYALYSIFSRFALDRGYHSLTISFYTFLFAIIGTLPLCDVEAVTDIRYAGIKTILFCFLFGLISTVIPYIVYTRGLQEMENSRASIIASIEPVTATILGVIVYNERMDMLNICGVILVIGAIIINNVGKDY